MLFEIVVLVVLTLVTILSVVTAARTFSTSASPGASGASGMSGKDGSTGASGASGASSKEQGPLTSTHVWIGDASNDATDTAVTSANGMTVPGPGATWTLNTPQDIRTTASPAFVGVSLQTSGGTPSVLNYFESTTAILTPAGAFATNGPNITVGLVRIGTIVLLTFPGPPSSFLASSTQFGQYRDIPTRFQPPAGKGINTSIITLPNGVTTVGMVATGVLHDRLDFYAAGPTSVNWTNGQSCAWAPFTLIWSTV